VHRDIETIMKAKRKRTKLDTYLATAIGVTTITGTGTTTGAIIELDVSSIGGANAGLSAGDSLSVPLSNLATGLSGSLVIRYQAVDDVSGQRMTGIGSSGGGASIASAIPKATPARFTTGDLISSETSKFNPSYSSAFYTTTSGDPATASAPDFGPDSFLGFTDDSGKYGWLEVTWSNNSKTFEILSGAYEDSGAAIRAGDTGISAIPEPTSNLALLALGSAGVLSHRRRRRAA
jgi:hypothetical protein